MAFVRFTKVGEEGEHEWHMLAKDGWTSVAFDADDVTMLEEHPSLDVYSGEKTGETMVKVDFYERSNLVSIAVDGQLSSIVEKVAAARTRAKL